MTTHTCDPSNWQYVIHEMMQAGDELVFVGGVFPGTIELPPKLYAAAGAMTILRSISPWAAVIDASGGYGDGIQLESNPRNVVIDGFRIVGARNSGVRVSAGKSVTIKRCSVSHCAVGGMLVYGSGHVIEDCLVEFNGRARRTDTGYQFGHGIYCHGDSLIIQGNVIRENAGYGLHGYNEGRTALVDSTVAHNVIHDHHRKSGLLVAGGKGVDVMFNVVLDNAVNLDLRNVSGERDGNIDFSGTSPWSAWFPHRPAWLDEFESTR